MLHHDVFIDFIYSLYLLPCTNVITTIHFFLQSSVNLGYVFFKQASKFKKEKKQQNNLET